MKALIDRILTVLKIDCKATRLKFNLKSKNVKIGSRFCSNPPKMTTKRKFYTKWAKVMKSKYFDMGSIYEDEISEIEMKNIFEFIDRKVSEKSFEEQWKLT